MPHSTLLILVLFAVGLIAVSMLRRVPVTGRSATLLRALLPSWRFFESHEGAYSLLVRTVEGTGEPGPFSALLEAPSRSLLSLVFAPRANLLLACHDLVETLVSELAQHGPLEIEQAERLMSYRLVQNMTAYFLRGHGTVPGVRYQLQLTCSSAEQGTEELFTSPYYALS